MKISQTLCLFLYLHAPGSGKYFPVDDNTRFRVGFFYIHGVPVRPDSYLQSLLEGFHCSFGSTFPEVIAGKKARSYAKKRDEENGETVDHVCKMMR